MSCDGVSGGVGGTFSARYLLVCLLARESALEHTSAVTCALGFGIWGRSRCLCRRHDLVTIETEVTS